MHLRKAFTFIELLVVLLIIVILAAVLFPVFGGARDSAHRVACMSNFRQAYQASMLYIEDYDDSFMPVNYRPLDEQNSRQDRTWVQLIMQYGGTFGIFQCPADGGSRPQREATFDEDLVPGETYSQYYQASLRSNIGYNFVYFSPVLTDATETAWVSQPKNFNSIREPSNTLIFVDSVWTRDSAGQPSGGGSWLVIPPCRYEKVEGETSRDTFPGGDGQIFTIHADGWDLENPVSAFQYGGAWPYHQGHITVIRADGSVKMFSPMQLGIGCEVKPNWEGLITDGQAYLWDF